MVLLLIQCVIKQLILSMINKKGITLKQKRETRFVSLKIFIDKLIIQLLEQALLQQL